MYENQQYDTVIEPISDTKSGLYGFVEYPPNPEGIVVFSHGILSGVYESQRFSYIKPHLLANSVGVCGTYYPQHGPRISERFNILSAVETLENTILYVNKRYPTVPISVMGTSVGSTIAMLLSESIQRLVCGTILFSFIVKLEAFLNFEFGQKHYDRWQSYGYNLNEALELLETLGSEARDGDYYTRIKDAFQSYRCPKLLIHGRNDRVTTYEEMAQFVDDNTEFLVFPGVEGRHDIRGLALESATYYSIHWLTKVFNSVRFT